MLEDFGLAVTLDAYVRRFSQRTGVHTELVGGPGDARMAAELELCVYRVVQEALTNVSKHAHASACLVFMRRLADSLVVTVEDDGKGFEPEQMSGERCFGVGLVGVRERVSHLRGTVRLDTRPGKGTRLTMELPVGMIAEGRG
jgi:two-component system sensor histidine kinase DegS